MGAFEYSALDQQGRLKKGVLEGDTPRQIRQQLREQGFVPVAVAGVKKGGLRSWRTLWQRKGINSADLALITRQIATLVRSGTVLEEALRAVSDQTDKAAIKSILLAVRSRVLEGHTLAFALADYPAIFSELYRSTVAAGEQAGYIDRVLEQLADYTEFRQQLKQKFMLSLLYPVIVTCIAVLVVLALLAYVVPQVVTVFESIGQDLPALTRGMIALSMFIKGYGLLLLAASVVLAVAVRFSLQQPGMRYRFHRLLLRLPFVARFVRAFNTAQFTRSFSILTASGVPVLEAMRVSAAVLTNLPMRQAVEKAAEQVREGGGLHKALAQSRYFPPITIHLIASGEASSNLDKMLERAAEDQERTVETLVTIAMGIFEPALILVMGGVVLLIVLAILLPIYDLNQLIR